MLRSIFTYFLCFLQIIYPLAGNADVVQAGKDGAALATEMQGWVDPRNVAQNADGSFMIGEDDDGNPITLGSDFFTDSHTNNFSAPAGSEMPQSDFNTYFSNESPGTMIAESQARMSSLFNDANKQEPDTMFGGVYKSLLAAKNFDRADLRNDPLTQPSLNLLNSIDLENEGFADCERVTDVNTVEQQGHTPVLNSCQKVYQPGASCELRNELSSAGIVAAVSDPANMAVCSDERQCMFGWIGRVGDNYWGGWCSIYDQASEYVVLDPERIESVTMERAIWDDYMQVFAGPEGNDRLIFSGRFRDVTNNRYVNWQNGMQIRQRADGTNETLYNGVWRHESDFIPLMPPETLGGCELNTSWNVGLSIDMTSFFKSVPAGTKIRFRAKASVGGNGEAYARFRLKYTPFDKTENQDVTASSSNNIYRSYDVLAPETSLLVENLSAERHTFHIQVLDDSGGYRDFTAPVSVDIDQEGGSYTLDWDAPTLRADNTPLPPEAIVSYRILHSRSYSSCLNTLERVQDTGLGTVSCTEFYEPDPLGCYTIQGAGGFVECNQAHQDLLCTNINGEYVCDDEIDDWPIPGTPKMCKTLTVNSATGGNCGVDENGESRCVDNSGFIEDGNGCKNYEDNPQCAFVSQNCVEGSELPNGQCGVLNQTFDCGYDASWNDTEVTRSWQCSGTMKCLGDECRDVISEESTSFVEAATLLSAVNFMSQDMSCAEGTIADNITCEIFKGTDYACKQVVGTVQDCCLDPVPTSMSTYFQMVASIGVLDMSITNLDSLVKVHDGTGATVDAIQGGWEAVKGPVVDSAEVVSEAFSTAYDTVAGPGTPIGDLAQVVGDQISQMTEQLTQAISEAATYVAEALGVSGGSGAAAGEVGQELAEEGATDLATQILGEAGAAYLSAAMTVMSAVSAAYLALQLAFPCEEEELILASKRGMEACHYVGSYCSLEIPIGGTFGGAMYCMETKDTYCCYNSPLSRIIMQSLRPQLGGFGSAENPRCEGIPLNQLETVDWDQVDWQPFINLMASAGQIPDPDDLTLDHLTGSGHQIQLDGGNLDAKTAAEEQLSDTSADDVRLHWQSNEDYYVGQ